MAKDAPKASRSSSAASLPPQQRTAVVRKLLAWFARHGRDLPWRRDSEPYRVWVSEIMLQQTQVERVCDYFRRFLEQFPDVHTLAAASEDDVLAAWQGLGYYRRARQLHACAKRLVAEHGGRFPTTVVELTALPGIGRYTASAIASIAFGVPAPIIEANSRRVLARLIGDDRPLAGTAGDGPLWEVAEAIVPKRKAGLFNQGLMDLGAMICRPAAPSCDLCPLATRCVAFRDGRTDEIPRMAKPRASVAVDEVVIVAVRRGKLLLVQRGEGEWWAGLWDFPRAPAPLGPLVRSARRDGRLLGEVRYGVTHHRVRADVVLLPSNRADLESTVRGFAPFEAGPAASEPAPSRWVSFASLDRVAMPSPARRIAALVEQAHRGEPESA